MTNETDTATIWIEIALVEHWGPKPHGIPRVAQNVFLQSRQLDRVRYFYYHRVAKAFVAAEDLRYFEELAAGAHRYADATLPAGAALTDALAPGDRLLLSEAAWDHADYLGRLLALRAEHPGVLFSYVLCDLIPLKFPHFFEAEFGSRVRAFMQALPSFCDRYLCISQSTARDVNEILAADARTFVFRLGADIVPAQRRPAAALQVGGRPYVLVVSTFEVRKNHILLYFVWRRLALELGEHCPKLVLVGRQGWIAGDVYTLFKTDPTVNRIVEIRHDVSDDELVDLITGSAFTVYPSYYEGWGLPASESLFYGKVCVTSNTSSLPEINPFTELMFDPYDHQQAYEVIRRLIGEPEELRHYERDITANVTSQTWENCVLELLALLEDESSKSRATRIEK